MKQRPTFISRYENMKNPFEKLNFPTPGLLGVPLDIYSIIEKHDSFCLKNVWKWRVSICLTWKIPWLWWWHLLRPRQILDIHEHTIVGKWRQKQSQQFEVKAWECPRGHFAQSPLWAFHIRKRTNNSRWEWGSRRRGQPEKRPHCSMIPLLSWRQTVHYWTTTYLGFRIRTTHTHSTRAATFLAGIEQEAPPCSILADAIELFFLSPQFSSQF